MELSEINLRQTALILKSHGEYFFDSSWRSDAPLETQSRLFFVQDGEMYYKIEGKDYVVSKNQLALIPENRRVKFGVLKDKLVHLRFCNFNAAFGNKSIFDYLEGDWVITVADPERTIELFKRFDATDNDNLIRDFVQKKFCLVSLLAEFMDESDFKIAAEKENSKINFVGIADFIRRNANSTDLITLRFLADMAHVHPSYFAREFKKHYGKSPMQYVLDERVASAKRQLANTSLSISAIAENMHFSNPKYFSKFFKRRTGMTPSQYRNEANKNNSSKS